MGLVLARYAVNLAVPGEVDAEPFGQPHAEDGAGLRAQFLPGQPRYLRRPVVDRGPVAGDGRRAGLYEGPPFARGAQLNLITQVPGRAFHGRLAAVAEHGPGVVAEVVAVMVE